MTIWCQVFMLLFMLDILIFYDKSVHVFFFGFSIFFIIMFFSGDRSVWKMWENLAYDSQMVWQACDINGSDEDLFEFSAISPDMIGFRFLIEERIHQFYSKISPDTLSCHWIIDFIPKSIFGSNLSQSRSCATVGILSFIWF